MYSVYGTQLALECNLTSSEAADLNISATLGSAVGGLIGGYFTDTHGTQGPVACSVIAISLGYFWLYTLYEAGEKASPVSLILAMLLVGFGATSSYFAAIKAVTISFPKYKGSAQSITIALFAISSLLYSATYSAIFHGDVAKFLMFLAVSSLLLQAIGAVFIRVDGKKKHQPLPVEESLPLVLRDLSSTDLTAVESKSDSGPLLGHLSLKQSLVHPIFWFHFVVMAVLQGLGQMYIYSVGFVVKAIHYRFTHSPDAVGTIPSLHSIQALHVSLIAVFSFIGRLTSGPMADTLVNKYRCQRHWVTATGTVVMFVGHFLLSFPLDRASEKIGVVNALLSVISCGIGFAYGLCFTSFPGIMADLFSMKNYSLLWGVMYLSTVPGLTIFTKLFGHFYDLHSVIVGGDLVCKEGSLCYLETFELTSVLSVIVFLALLCYIYCRRTRQ